MYVGGGLQIHYISNKINAGNTNAFIDALSLMFNPENEADILDAEEKLEKATNSAATRESYRQHQSIYKYIECCKSGSAWAESDEDSDDFKNFIHKIGEARKRANLRGKFQLAFEMWTEFNDEDSFIKDECYIYPILRFKPESDGERNYAISKVRLRSWQINLNSSPCFNLRIKEGDNILKDFFYTICLNGDYISSEFEKKYDLETKCIADVTPEFLNGMEYKITITNPETQEEQIIPNPIMPAFAKGYIQLYSNDSGNQSYWTTEKGRYSTERSGVIYDKSRFSPLLQSDDQGCDLNDKLGWICFKSSVVLKDNANENVTIIYNNKGQIYAHPKADCIHSITRCPAIASGCFKSDGSVKCVINESEEYIFFVNEQDIEFEVKSFEKDEPIIDYRIQFKKYDEDDFTEYTDQLLSQGLYVFRLMAGNYSTDVYCYVLKKDARFSIDRVNHQIKPSNIDSLSCIDELRLSGKGNYCVPEEGDKAKYEFILDNIVHISVYSPWHKIYIYHDGLKLDRGAQIIMAYASQYSVVDIAGRNEYMLDSCYKANQGLLRRLTNTALEKHSVQMDSNIDIELDGFKIRAYTDTIKDDTPLNDGSFYLLSLDGKSEVTKVTAEFVTDIRDNIKTDSLLFQSLKNCPTPPQRYYAPLYIGCHDNQHAVWTQTKKVRYRQDKIQKFQKKKAFCSEEAFKQFEIACEHRLYFAFSDILLSMGWQYEEVDKNPNYSSYEPDRAESHVTKKRACFDFLEKNSKGNLHKFFNDYVSQAKDQPNIEGLKRLAKEFSFRWEYIAFDEKFSNIHDQLINN